MGLSATLSAEERFEYLPGFNADGVRSKDLDRFLEDFLVPEDGWVPSASFDEVVDVLDFFFAGEFDGDEFFTSLLVVSSSCSNPGLLMSLMIKFKSAASSWVSVLLAI